MLSSRLTLVLVWAGTSAIAACGGGEAPASGRAAIASAPPASPPEGTSAAAAAKPAAEIWTDAEAAPSAPELAPGTRAALASRWFEARKELGAGLAKIRDEASIDEVLAGEAWLGRACAELGDAKCAEDAYGAVLAAWHGAETAKEVQDAGANEAARKQRLHRALLAVAEALFFAAEQKRHAMHDVLVPGYTGPNTKEAIRAHVDEKVVPWTKQKQALAEEVEAAYGKIAALEPPPPRWVVRASARVGQTWGRFAAELRAAPLPAEWRGDGPLAAEMRAAYYAALDGASQPQRKRAREAFEKCKSDGERLGIEDDFARSCQAWLAKTPPPSP